MKANITNRTIFTGENLHVLRGMNDESVDLIYLDPPFNSNRTYSAPIGSEAAGAAFRDTWTLDDVDVAWHGEIAEREPALYEIISAAGLAHSTGMRAYLIMMAVRLLEMRRVLADTGSVYLHCDPTASHYLKAVMDCVFGRANFRNEIVWCYSGGGIPKRDFPRKHDSILRYAGENRKFDIQRKPYKQNTQHVGKHSTLSGGHAIDLERGTPVTDWWTDLNTVTGWSPEKTGYPTQKPLALLERIIRASSGEGDTVLDPFCGCATTLIAAEKLNRHWIGIDLSPMAVTLVRRRMERELGGLVCEVTHREDIPERTDLGKLPDYRTHKHSLYGEQEGVCRGCKIHFPFANLTVDHIWPRSKGGTDARENLQLLCGACNSIKGQGSMTQLRARLDARDRR